jgi:uroporphyrinogen-III synthase
MHVLITRPERDSGDLKSRIETLGCKVTVAPLIEIAINVIAASELDGSSGLIATSRNGLRAIALSPSLEAARSLPLFAVGPATAALARELGFREVIVGAGTAADLVPLIKDHAGTQRGTLAHLAGDHLTFDLGTALAAIGLGYQRINAYRSVAAKTLDEHIARLLANHKLDAVILMSPRTASVWANLVRALSETPDLSKVTHICISNAVAKALQSLAPTKIEVSGAPASDEIVALVYRLAGACKTG